MEAHQQRVLDEKSALDEKLGKLLAFLATPTFDSLDPAEQMRLSKQYAAMDLYSKILAERIAAFPTT